MSILSDINIGNLVVVSENNAKNPLKERLLSLGITNGACIEVVRKGPKNNLTVYRIRGAMVALRSEEASLIKVSLVS